MWCGLSLVLVILAPTQVWEGVSFWTAPERGLTQTLLGAVAFLALALWLETKASTPKGVSALAAIVGAAACYGTAYIVFSYVRPVMVYSRAQFLLSAAFGVALAFLPHVIPSRLRVIRVVALSAIAFSILVAGFGRQLREAPTTQMLSTALKPITKTSYANLVPPVTMYRGGAIEPYGRSFLLITGDGDFYSLDWTTTDGAPVARRLSLSLPADRHSSSPGKDPVKERWGDHRVLDLKIDAKSSPAKVYVSSQEWNAEGQCYAVRVSVAVLDVGALASQEEGSDPWTRLFETSPCVSPSAPSFSILESGGRLAFYEDELLLTVGDFHLSKKVRPPPSQSADSPYGKVLRIDRSGGHEVFTSGHRNPQGLLVDSEGRIWLTEHGAQGGDELNLLQRGNNYGHPFATYSTEYGSYVWPMAPNQHDHGAFTEPVHAFVPSIGISNVISIQSNAFQEWKQDLLVASLNGKSLYRVRLRDTHVIYVEPIFIGVRIRDLAEGADGRIVMWTDGGKIVTLTSGSSGPIASVVFTRCRQCHESPAGAESLGPSIRSIVGSGVASGAGYPYSSALKQVGGKWTTDRLDAFLKDPDAFAPGSDMAAGQVPDDKERRAVIEFLKTYK